MISCKGCQKPVVNLADACLAGTNLVADLSTLHAYQRETHKDFPKLKFKTGKLRCISCGENLGNVQNNINMKPWKGKEVACLKFDTMRFTTAWCTEPVKLSSASLQKIEGGSGKQSMWLTEEIIVEASGGKLVPAPPAPVGSRPGKHGPRAMASVSGTEQQGKVSANGVSVKGVSVKNTDMTFDEGATTSKFYAKNGTCRFGQECECDHSEGSVSGSMEREGDAEKENVPLNSLGLPLRPGAMSCEHFHKHGNCKFGAECWKDHPEPEDTGKSITAQGQDFKGNGASFCPLGLPVRPGTSACKFFVKNGTCKFGSECTFDHPKRSTVDSSDQQGKADKPYMSLNRLGLPMRPGAAPCEFFQKHGNCKFGEKCWKDHPQEEAASISFEDQGQNATDDDATLNSMGLPHRAGVSACKFYMKHGSCKFGKKCEFDHPEQETEKASSEDPSENSGAEDKANTSVNSIGLPLWPGSPACQPYLKTGRCKFGMKCKKDHPENVQVFNKTTKKPDVDKQGLNKDPLPDTSMDAALWNAKRKSQVPSLDGVISEYFSEKGFGFIRFDCPERGRTKLFFHISAVTGSGGLAPHKADKVCFQIGARKPSSKSAGSSTSESKVSAQRVVIEAMTAEGRTVEDLIAHMDSLTSQLHCCDEDFLKRRQTLANLSDCPAFWCMITTLLEQSARAEVKSSTFNNDPLRLLSSLLSLLHVLLDTGAALGVIRVLLESSLYDAGSAAASLLARALCTHSLVREKHNELSAFASKSLPGYAYRLLSVLEHAVEHADTNIKMQLLPLLLQLLKTATVSNAKTEHPEVALLDWKSMPLEPTTHELLPVERRSVQRAHWTRESALPKVRKIGAYSDVGTYMDTYLRLLREDCFHALKKGVRQYLAGNLDQRDMRTYSCRLAGLSLQGARGRAGVALVLHVKPHREVRDWKFSDALMFGNLLCLSGDGKFREPLWVTVLERVPEILQSKGLILVELCAKTHVVGDASRFSLVDAVKSLLSMGDIVAAESPTYYRAYQPVLETLQSMDVRSLPFQSELVSVVRPESDAAAQYPCMPQYLQRVTWLNDRVVFDKAVRGGRSNTSMSPVEALVSRLDDAACKEQCPESTLDHFQLAAVRHVLTNRLAVIQGGPGCGKSTVGIRLVRLLLSCIEGVNEDSQKLDSCFQPSDDGEEDEPVSRAKRMRVLVIAYKNHALDDILSGLMRSGIRSVARVGGRSTNKELEERNLNVLRRERSTEGQAFFRQRKALEEQLDELRPGLEAAAIGLASCRFFTPKSFVKFASRSNIESLLRDAPTDSSAKGTQRKKRSAKAAFDDAEFLLDAVDRALDDVDLNFHEFLSADPAELSPIVVGLQEHVLQAIDRALDSWMPASDEFERVNSQIGGRTDEVTRSLDALSHHKHHPHVSAELEAEDEVDKDLEEVEKERLAAQLETGRSGKERDFLNGMISLLTAPRQNSQVEFSLLIAARMGPMEEAALLEHAAVWDMTPVDRVLLTQLTLARQLREVECTFVEAFEEFVAVLGKLQQLEDTESVSVLRRQQVVGMTSTGACLYQHYVRELQPTVVIVEEAAEMLESHVLPLLQQSVEHVILIGDQNQLPPSVNAYHLKKDHGFALSMMERMICNGLEYATLMRQSRMHQDFSVFLRDRYPKMEDNLDVVEQLAGPECMAQRLFWWNHTDPEKEGRSPSNPKEAERVVRLAMYLVLQGVPVDKITILSPYVGQVMLLRKLVKQRLPDVQSEISKVSRLLKDNEEEVLAQLDVQVADKFQGDENEVIIVSMVRSNPTHTKGFMETDEGVNRRVVMQSRQKKALFIVGNARCFECNKNKGGVERPSKVWSSYIRNMRQQQRLGDEIVLQCPRHKATLRAGNADKIPDSLRRTVCNQPCNAEMDCGHRCPRNCHHEWKGCHDRRLCTQEVCFACEAGHPLRRRCNQSAEEIQCRAAVQFSCPVNSTHVLTRECWQLPSDVQCYALVNFQCPQGHALQRKCCENPEEVVRRCKQPCGRKLPCGHVCPGICGNPCDPSACKVSIPFTCKMGHPQQRYCGQAEAEVPCSFPCQKVLPCGHACPHKCGQRCPVLPSQCPLCIEERKIAIEKEKEAAQMLKQQAMAEAVRQLEELRANPEAMLPPRVLKPRDDDVEISDVKRRVDKLGKALMLNLQVDEIRKVSTVASQQHRQLEAKKHMSDPVAPSKEQLYFVTKKVAEKIAMTGIRLPEKGKGCRFGRAVVFRASDDKDGTLVLCDVLVGRTWSVQRDHRDFWQLGHITAESLRDKGYDSILAPSDREQHEELAIYDAAAIRPQYIVSYKMEPMASSLAAQPTYWTSKGAETGRGWRAVLATKDEKSALSQALEIEGSLGGRDTREPGRHTGFQLKCAWRIEHPGLWGKFSSERWNMKNNEWPLLHKSGVTVPKIKVRQGFYNATKQLPADLEGDLNEVFLSHGTKPETVLSILSSGCNERYSGGLFGNGTYFAEDVAKNDQYVRSERHFEQNNELHKILYKDVKHPGSVCYVLFCRVLLGFPIITQDGRTRMRQGGTIWASENRELAVISGVSRAVNHHSLLAETGGKIERFREFIVFHGDRVYPEYLVAYQRH